MLTYADREALWIVGIDLRATVEIVEAVVARHVTAALTEAADAIWPVALLAYEDFDAGRQCAADTIRALIPTNSPPAAAAPDG